MKRILYSFYLAFVLLTIGSVTSAFYLKTGQLTSSYRFPYKQAGLTDREAAAHLLSRFSFGTRPNEIDVVVKTGLETWFAQQLQANLEDAKVEAALANFQSLKMTNEEIVNTYPKPGQVLRKAVQDGAIERDSVNLDKKDAKDELKAFMEKNGMKPQAELLRELVNQKILRA